MTAFDRPNNPCSTPSLKVWLQDETPSCRSTLRGSGHIVTITDYRLPNCTYLFTSYVDLNGSYQNILYGVLEKGFNEVFVNTQM